MVSNKKQLYMAKNLQQLKEKSNEMKYFHSIKQNPMKIIKAMMTLNQKLQDVISNPEQDEEMIYFLSFRMLSLWQILQGTDGYKSDNKYFKSMIGKEVFKALGNMEDLDTSLNERYNAEIKQNTPEKKYSEVSDWLENNESEVVISQVEDPVSITCTALKEKILSNENILIIDTRPESDFNASRLSKGKMINIPGSIISPGISAGMLRKKLIGDEDKYKWDSRSEYKLIIMLDWRTEEKTFTPGSVLYTLKTIFLKWDPATTYKEKPLILDGGYDKFLDQYPHLTTNPKPDRPKISESYYIVPLDEIVYPMTYLADSNESLKHNNTVSPSPSSMGSHLFTPASIPVIDRSTKPEQVKQDDVIDESQSETELKSDSIIDSSEELSEPITEKPSTDDPKSVIKKTVESSDTPTSSPTAFMKNHRPPPDVPSKKTVMSDIGDGDSDVSSVRLKSDDSISPTFSSGMKRSLSSPNIAKLKDDSDITPKAKPQIDRSSKPSPRTSDSFTPRSHGVVPRGLTGLKNLGNLCYMNSIIQCVSNTEELKKQLISISTPCKINRNSKTKGQIYEAVKQLICLLHQGAYRWVTCRELKSVVGQFRNTFAGYEQQDSHEFLTELMDWLHEDLNCPTPNFSLQGASEDTGERAWGEFKKKNESIVLELFYGQLRSTITCCECRKKSVTFDPFSNLSLPLPMDKDKCRLADCITLYLTGETISGWNCPRCKEPRQAVKKLDITRLPPILVIHLKRFMTEGLGTGWSRKRTNMIDFPLEDLDMKQYAVNSEQRFHTYNLYAVSNHYGTMDSGHYTAYCKNFTCNKWYKFDDQEVSEMSTFEVNSPAAYILFYNTVRS